MSEFPVTIIQGVTGETVSVDVTSKNKILDLKKKIEIEYGLNPADQALVFANQQLNDDTKEVSEYGIIKDSTIVVVAKLKGGNI